MALKVIGAGFPRTGTNSLKRSLEMLGISKTYHFKDLVKNPDNLHLWEQLEQTNTTDWETIYEGYQGSVDFPCYPWYKEHMEVYPDAKVIMTVRPFEDWYASMKSTIWVSGPQTPIEKMVFMGKMAFDSNLRKTIKCVKFVKKFLWERQFEGRFLDKEFVKTVWEKHHQEVKDHVPAEKLLVYDIRTGWEPLCKFLDLPVPTEALPHLNKRENFKAMLKEMMDGKEA